MFSMLNASNLGLNRAIAVQIVEEICIKSLLREKESE
jgi:hypothetical protein